MNGAVLRETACLQPAIPVGWGRRQSATGGGPLQVYGLPDSVKKPTIRPFLSWTHLIKLYQQCFRLGVSQAGSWISCVITSAEESPCVLSRKFQNPCPGTSTAASWKQRCLITRDHRPQDSGLAFPLLRSLNKCA